MINLILLLSFIGIAIGRLPGLRMNRATISLVGAVLVSLFVVYDEWKTSGVIRMDELYRSIDPDTIILLFSMMVISVNLRLSGFFSLAAGGISFLARTPRVLLALIIVASGGLSALFLNDTVVLMFTPFIVTYLVRIGRPPVPYLLGLATGANIGSMATLIGNPQNMLIGMSSGISFLRFSSRMVIPSLLSLVLAWLCIVLIHRKEFSGSSELLPGHPPAVRSSVYKPLLYKCILSTLLLSTGIILGIPLSLASLAAASLLLITRRIKPMRVFREIDWSLLVLFAGLFVLTDVMSRQDIMTNMLGRFLSFADRSDVLFSLSAAALSNLISNVPAVMILRPVIGGFSDPEKAWMLLSMSTTLAGNLTLVGSVANLIVAESASRQNVHLGFRVYLKTGVPVTILTLAGSLLYLKTF